MQAVTQSDALKKLARQIKSLEAKTELYFLPSDPYHGPSGDNDVHVVVLLDVSDPQMAGLCEEIAALVQDINVELEYDPFVVAHPTNRNATLAQTARRAGVRL